MNYKETLNFMFSQLPMYQRSGKAAYKANLDNTIAFDNYLNHPHTKYKTIHIGGTNGKGSVSHILASVLREAGYKVGLYTSPHLKDFRERVKINGENITKNSVVEFISENKDFISELKPSFFEMTVFMALDYFEKQNIDIAIIEVGLGGRLDSTNIITPILSVITNIGLDHTAFLGTTLPEISSEKVGIIKQNVSVIIGESQHETTETFTSKAKSTNSKIIFADKNINIEYSLLNKDNTQEYKLSENNLNLPKLTIDLLGKYQEKNAVTALQSIIELKKILNISNTNIIDGFKNVVNNTNLLGRWQILGANPRIICDTAHNLEGLTYVINQIKQTPYKTLHFVFGTVNDKNIDKILCILPKNAIYYFTQADIPRALDKKILFEKAKNNGLSGKIYESVKKAIESAKNNSNHNDLIFIGGSTFIVAEAI